MKANKMLQPFINSFSKYFKKDIILKNEYLKHFLKHEAIVEKLNIKPEYFYDTINDYLNKNNINPLIGKYTEFLILTLMKTKEKRTVNYVVDDTLPIEKQNKIKAKFQLLWHSNNIFKTNAFLYRTFTKEFLLQDTQFMTLYNAGYNFQGFRKDIEDYLKI